jgi:hypothetical protein
VESGAIGIGIGARWRQVYEDMQELKKLEYKSWEREK